MNNDIERLGEILGGPSGPNNAEAAEAVACGLRLLDGFLTNLDRIATALEDIRGEGFHPEWGIAPTLRERMRG